MILFDETIRQDSLSGTPFPKLLEEKGIIPGIKVDTGAKPLALSDGETVTEGLDGLADRLAEYHHARARFAKWRATYTITDDLPSRYCYEVNAHTLSRYAALCQAAGIVPIVEPEVYMEGTHTIDRASDVTAEAQAELFHELHRQRVLFEGILLKPNMVLSGYEAKNQASDEEVAEKTIRCFGWTVPDGDPRHRVPLRRPDRRAGHQPPQRDEQARPAPVGALVLVRACAAGAGAQGVARRPGERAGGPGRVRAPRQDEQRGPLGQLRRRDGEARSQALPLSRPRRRARRVDLHTCVGQPRGASDPGSNRRVRARGRRASASRGVTSRGASAP